MLMKEDLASMTPDEIKALVLSLSEPGYRAGQLFGWISRGAGFDSMTNIPASLKEKLSENHFISSVKIFKKFVSRDGTVKYLFELYDGEKIESVFMEYEHGNTVCVSTEAGCPMGCSFCASTLNGLSRKLLPGEMLAQVAAAAADTGKRVSNIVLMGIGEPLDNYDNTVKFIRLVSAPEGMNIGCRHISLSTCGLVDRIYRLADEGLPITLSVSLHASDDETRSALMPVNRKWNISSLLTACADYFRKTGRRISFEYTLVGGKNDSASAASALASVLRRECGSMPLHVNLIPVNPVKERGFLPPSAQTVAAFVKTLSGYGVNATVRRRLGEDINASCGQLRAENAEITP